MEPQDTTLESIRYAVTSIRHDETTAIHRFGSGAHIIMNQELEHEPGCKNPVQITDLTDAQLVATIAQCARNRRVHAGRSACYHCRIGVGIFHLCTSVPLDETNGREDPLFNGACASCSFSGHSCSFKVQGRSPSLCFFMVTHRSIQADQKDIWGIYPSLYTVRPPIHLCRIF